MKNPDLHTIASQLKNGDTTQLKVLFDEHSRYCIKRLVFKYDCPEEEAKDIYVDSILNLRDKLVEGKVTAVIDVRGYLFATCKNMFLTNLKRRARIERAATETFRTRSEAEEVEQKEQRVQTVESALATLGSRCKEVLTAFYFLKLDLEEIATKFNMANANVAKVTKSRCLQRLIENVKSTHKQKEEKFEWE